MISTPSISLNIAGVAFKLRSWAAFSTTTEMRRMTTACLPKLPNSPEIDFAHHDAQVSRLNHGSFGACPTAVLHAQHQLRSSWLAQPDIWFFSGKLQSSLAEAAASVIPFLTKDWQLDNTNISKDQVCLVENATVATLVVANRWSHKLQPGDVVVTLSVIYGACLHALREYCEKAGAEICVLKVPFPAKSAAHIMDEVEGQLKVLSARGRRIRFAFMDHVSSQPALLLPVHELVAACRRHGTDDMEIAVDGAHSIGSCAVDVQTIGADWFFSNLHKWAFAPPTATVLQARSPHLMQDTRHPIVSWAWGAGLQSESQFTGTRDYSAMLAVPAAMAYLRDWRSSMGECAPEYCRRRVIESGRELSAAWGTESRWNEVDDELIATQAMVKLPVELRVDDVPGQPGQGVRAKLRDDFGVEAAIGNFQGEIGAYVRLSYAIYNTPSDIARLRDGILHILDRQRGE